MGFAVGSTHPTVPLFVSRTRPSRWRLSNLHRMLAPLLDAAVASVQAHTKPVPSGRKITGLVLVRAACGERVSRVGEKSAYAFDISDWRSDVCISDLKPWDV